MSASPGVFVRRNLRVDRGRKAACCPPAATTASPPLADTGRWRLPGLSHAGASCAIRCSCRWLWLVRRPMFPRTVAADRHPSDEAFQRSRLSAFQRFRQDRLKRQPLAPWAATSVQLTRDGLLEGISCGEMWSSCGRRQACIAGGGTWSSLRVPSYLSHSASESSGAKLHQLRSNTPVPERASLQRVAIVIRIPRPPCCNTVSGLEKSLRIRPVPAVDALDICARVCEPMRPNGSFPADRCEIPSGSFGIGSTSSRACE